MKLQHIMGAKLTLDSGVVLTLERLGKGQFHTCYVDRATAQVYSITISRDGVEDSSKEILSHPTLGVDINPHLPAVEHIGEIGDRRVYRMPLYHPLRAAHTEAWGQFKQLLQAREAAWAHVAGTQARAEYKLRVTDWGHDVNNMVCTIMDSPSTSVDLREALWGLRDAASNYGQSYCMEFSKRNCMVDEAGRLILLDVLFNLEAVAMLSNARERKQRGY